MHVGGTFSPRIFSNIKQNCKNGSKNAASCLFFDNLKRY